LVHRVFPEVTFFIAGEGAERPALQQLIDRRSLSGNFTLLGVMQDTATFLANVDIAVSSSRFEGLSNAVMEYMAAGRAIVATAVGGNVELIDEGRTGLLVPSNDPQALADNILRLLDEPGLAVSLGGAARCAVPVFCWQRVADLHEQFYRARLASRPFVAGSLTE
jgi:glycosyltransferase involved in cell wall biosynthesis